MAAGKSQLWDQARHISECESGPKREYSAAQIEYQREVDLLIDAKARHNFHRLKPEGLEILGAADCVFLGENSHDFL